MNKKGFLLLEVMVSVVLVAGGLVAVTMSFSVSKKLLFESRHQFGASLLLREKMFEIEQKGVIDDALSKEALPDDLYELSLKAAAVKDSGLERIELTMAPHGEEDAGYTIDTYLKKKER